jgi:hypothetical protein
MEGPLPESWTRPGRQRSKWPNLTLPDGTRLESFGETLECDAPRRIWRSRRTIVVHHPDGRTETHDYVQQKHPVSFAEVAG